MSNLNYKYNIPFLEGKKISSSTILSNSFGASCEKIKFEHLGGQSHNPKFNFEATLSRNWHYCWSKFYYLKKYRNYFYALKKTLPILLRAVLKCIKYKLLNNKKQYKIHLAEIKGLISAYLFKKSTYRPYESKK